MSKRVARGCVNLNAIFAILKFFSKTKVSFFTNSQLFVVIRIYNRYNFCNYRSIIVRGLAQEERDLLVREILRLISMTTDNISSVRRRLFYLAFRTSDCIVRSFRRCVPSFAIARARVNPHRRKEARLMAGSSAGRSGCLLSITRNKTRNERIFSG